MWLPFVISGSNGVMQKLCKMQASYPFFAFWVHLAPRGARISCPLARTNSKREYESAPFYYL